MLRAALYARFSTDRQSEASIPDQFRLAERLAQQHGFRVVARFSDAAISGGTTSRPGYQDLLTAARQHDFDVIVAEDTTRLWRNLAEQAPRIAELADLGDGNRSQAIVALARASAMARDAAIPVLPAEQA